MAPVLDATLGGAASNSYVDLAFADAYAANTQWDAEWLAFSVDQRTAALITATSWLETLGWSGDKCTPATQRLSWPRSGVTCQGLAAACTFIPYEVQTCQVELAFQFAKNPNLMLGSTGTSTVGEVKRQKLDVLEIEYYESGGGVINAGTKLTDQVPWLIPWLGCWVGGNAGQIRLYRN